VFIVVSYNFRRIMSTQSLHPAILLTDLVYRYRSADDSVVNISKFSLKKGEQILLTGASGSGKSTLLHLLSGLMDPESGSIKIQDTAINQLRGSKRDRFRGAHIGMIFQTYQLLHGFSARENILAALMFSDLPRPTHNARAHSLLKVLGINKPNQLVEEMSVGQQQRVAVARAVACSPTVVLADEPTASLDPDHAQGAMDLLQEACRSIDAALICVSHDHSLITRFDRHQSLDELNTPNHGSEAQHGHD
jgi:putative ABC transport system ATP-binding protein